MSAEIDTENSPNDEDICRLINEARIKTVSEELQMLTADSKMTSDKIKDLQSSSDDLKIEIEKVVNKIEQNIDVFQVKLSKKIVLILHLLSDKQTHIQCALDNCFGIISHLVETFLAIGHELENDIAAMTLKVNTVESEIRKFVYLSEVNLLKLQANDKGIHWFINSEGRLTKQKYSVVGPVLPEFKCGDKNTRQEFIWRVTEAFNHYQVPESEWVKLATSQFVGMAQDWWRLHCDNDNNIDWKQFCSCFMDWTFSNSENINYDSNFNGNHNGGTFIDNLSSKNINRSRPGSSCNSNKNEMVKKSDENRKTNSKNVQFISNDFDCNDCISSNSSKTKDFLRMASKQTKLENSSSEFKKGLGDLSKADCSDSILSCASGDDSFLKLFHSDSEETGSGKEGENSADKRRNRK